MIEIIKWLESGQKISALIKKRNKIYVESLFDVIEQGTRIYDIENSTSLVQQIPNLFKK